MAAAEGVAGSTAVLSIQSHVVHGHVGNKSAVFPLQLLGVEVDAINSVQFSNHTGYDKFTGGKLGGGELWALYEGLADNGLDRYTHLLTGYMGSGEVLDTVTRIAKQLKAKDGGCVYVCDPVLGDNGTLYVPADLVARYRVDVIPLADVVTPNQFEVEQLTDGGPIVSVAGAFERVQQLHAMGPRTVVVSSLDEGLCPDGEMLLLGSHAAAGGKAYTFTLTFPRVKNFYFTGTGDLLAALFLAWLQRHPDEPHRAAQAAVATVQAVIRRTRDACAGLATAPTARDRELRLVQSKRDIEDPDVEGVAVVCNPKL